MQITEIKVGELVSFVESEQYERFHPKPITRLRAVSQANNPDAHNDDIALIVAHENDAVLGFVGLLPRNTIESNQHVYSNTCWWVDPEKGKGIAVPLFLMALKKCNFKMYLADCTSYTQSILEKTGYFQFAEPQPGIRGILRFYISDIFQKRFKGLSVVRWIISVVDFVLNLIWSPVLLYHKRKIKNPHLELNEITTVDNETANFIQSHSENEFILKSQSILEWIKRYPWVTNSLEEEKVDYPFSYLVNKYSLKYYTLKNEGDLIAFVAISVRDNLVKIPFIYFDNNFEREVLNAVFHYIMTEKYDSVVVFHPKIISYLQANKMPFLYKKRVWKRTGSTNELYKYFSLNPFLQDGDGDVVFT